MIQEVITYIIITIAFGTVIYKIIHFFSLAGKKNKNRHQCSGCSSGGCDIKELHIANKPFQIKKDQYRLYL